MTKPKGFCAYHNEFNSNGNALLYAIQPGLDATRIGCTNAAPSASLSPNNDPDADNVLTAVSHELFETVTDPRTNTSIGWCDGTYNAGFIGFGVNCSNGEIGDKCNQMFPGRNSDGSDIVVNGHPYILQQEFSNRQSASAQTKCSMS
jgi:hypothetical protein